MEKTAKASRRPYAAPKLTKHPNLKDIDLLASAVLAS
jgi:hypothetical protein